ncbi:Fumarate reductase iron-sulfur subunit [Rosistilla oblonga]|uniref:succinate dehydrogenase n=3 Tax=Rosistilla TaxID=2795779 RepID=A0A518IWK5_9BACT|nr:MULTISPECIES: succinate dehydrogenase iron-sulfur subunit [Rosistilla]QDS90282.1 Fumarate reductase iron-sulfur subunit [Rosistilla ulvae]QDV14419.1 Fumarate reductase iron-sulfur subunit [Rosistilla oblonga]QDV57445.1 Fumarate reductase iron-sulfur subunit [Rosistilla oblonga]QDV70736.1 Fumarate reductase iron-sulfur subunit [Rosistilla carotiformis]
MIAPEKSMPDTIDVRILRQEGPGKKPYWERHRIQYEREMNVISVLQKVAAQAKTVEGKDVAPVAWDCGCLEEVCGSCTMVINGRVRQSCSALVDKLLADQPSHIELAPMTKFPVLRDLLVDRSRLFRGLKKIKAWVPVDGYYDMGPGERQSREQQEQAYPLSQCMSCGCCLDACPQYKKIEVDRITGESEEDYQARCNAEYDNAFIGANAISQVMLFNDHPVGKMMADERMEALTEPGGIQVCGNAQNCVAVCPKEIPLTTSIARAGRAATVHAIKQFFDR